MFFIISCIIFAERQYGDVKQKVTLVDVYDGDTFTVCIAKFPPIIGSNIGIRVLGIDTPEMHSSNTNEQAMARKAKEVSEKILRSGKVIQLKNIIRDKYFRIGADVFVDGKSLADQMIAAGVAVPYDGGTKKKW